MIKFCLFLLILFFIPSTVFAQVDFNLANQKVCDRFEEDVSRLSAIMDEVRSRKGITETRVAFGGVDTPIKSADYWITYGAEAIAYQRAKNYSSKTALKSDLITLQGKVLKAKGEVKKVLSKQSLKY